MKLITWQQFLDIINDPNSGVYWDGTLCSVVLDSEKTISFFYEEEYGEYCCVICASLNKEIQVEGNKFRLVEDEDTDDLIELEIFRKVPWIIE